MDSGFTTALIAVPALIVLSGALVFGGFRLAERATMLGRADLVKILDGMRADARKVEKDGRSDYRYLVNLIAAKDPMAVQALESVSTISNPQPIDEGPLPPGEEEPRFDGTGVASDFDEALAEAKSLGIKIPQGYT